MESSVNCNFRELMRTEINQRRCYERDYNLSSKRNIVKETICNLERVITQEEVETIANNIKQKKKVNVNDLALLKLSFLQNCDNIIVFLKIKGALQSLIRELTGSNSINQLAAVECLCNLSLGSPKSCVQVAKAASPYLISHLQGLNYNLMNTSVWTLGNIAGSDIKSWEVVRSQGILQRLIHLLNIPELVDNTCYAICQFLKVGLHKLEGPEVKELTSALIKDLSDNSAPNRCLALYLISCSQLSEDIFVENNIVEVFVKVIKDGAVTVDSVKCITALVRVISNVIPEESGVIVNSVLANWQQMQNIISNLLVSGYSHFKAELMWFVGNVINHKSIVVQEFLKNKSDEIVFLFK